MKTCHRSALIRCASIALLSFITVRPVPAAVAFYGAGLIPGGDYASQARDAKLLPGGGLLMVGTMSLSADSAPAGDTSVAWTPQTGWQILADLYPSNPAIAFITARVISADGNVIGGSTRLAPTGALRSPCLWTNHGTTVNALGLLPGAQGHPNVGLNCLSADGSIGYGFDLDARGIAAFRYTAAGGIVDLGYLHSDDDNTTPCAHGASADGRVMAGNSSRGISPLSAYRYVYTGQGPTGGTMTALPALAGGTITTALVITPDANAIIGTSNSPDFPSGQLVLWRPSGRPEALGSPVSGDRTFGFNNLAGVTDAGDAVVVSGGPDATNPEAENVTLTSYLHNHHGWFALQPLLARGGADLTGWVLDSVEGASNDGTVLFGSGQHNGQQEAWVAIVPKNFMKNAGPSDGGNGHEP